MDKDVFWGFAALCAFGSPFVALAGIIVYKVYRKFRPASKVAQVEKRREARLVVPSAAPEPPGPLRVGFHFSVLTLLVVLSGLIIGGSTALVASVVYMSILFPAGMGLVGGSILADGARRLKVRKSHALTVLAVLLAVITYGTFHYSNYIALQFRTHAALLAEAPDMAIEDSQAISRIIVDAELEEETGYTGFAGYMLYRAKEGVTVGRFYRTSRTNLGPVLSWFYWVLEFVIILGVILITVAVSSDGKLCKFCGSWYRETHLGGAPANHQDDVLDLVKRREFAALGSMLEENAEVPSLELYLRGCEACNQGSSRLIVRRTSLSSKGLLEFTDVSKTVLPPAERVRLVDQFRSVRVPN